VANSQEANMAQSDLFLPPKRPWTTARIIGPRPPFKPKHIWGIRQQLKANGRVRDLAMFSCAIDAKPRGCDLVKLRVSDVAPGGLVRPRATIIQQKTGQPVPLIFRGEAVISYTRYLAEIDEGRSANVAAPQIALDYWNLPADATLRDVVEVVRADEAHHRDVNHSFANELAGMPTGEIAPCPPHVVLELNWKTAA
jgi:hypothetical protein